ncbi:MAG: DEAD/DEAH box helicase [Oligoflexia bacterium]|jgi:ATP-dependent RNA helicase DeaD
MQKSSPKPPAPSVGDFSSLNLSPPLLQAITELGFSKPSQIQAEALPILLGEPTDFIGLAATGTGKTAAFSLPLLERLDPALKEVQALVLCPTRELAIQVAGQIELMGKHLKIKALPVYGGAGYGDQIFGLKRGAQVVVGTPGRLVDHLSRGTLLLNAVKTVVLDEADEMISMGFKEDLTSILGAVPENQANVWLFSATMSPEVRSVADEYLHRPAQVQINRTEMLPQNIEQIFYVTQESNKPEVLCKLVDAADDFYGLVFFQTKALLMDVAQFLSQRGYAIDCLHGDMDQTARERTMKSFRERKVTMLLCTDVASRGLDVKDITHVINYSIPRELDNYVHRIGRTARSGKSGFAMSLVSGAHRGLIPRIERMTRSRMVEGRIPSRREIAAKKISKILEAFSHENRYDRAVELMGLEWRDAISDLAPDEIAGRFLTLMFPDLFSERTAQKEESSRPERPSRKSKYSHLHQQKRGAGSSHRSRFS